jgi:toxin-antitoxin system PIN domain toxin
VIVIDANLLLYAYDTTAKLHLPAKSWLEGCFSGSEPIAIPWLSIGAFLRVATNLRLGGDRYTAAEAVEVVESWLANSNVRLLSPGERAWWAVRELLLSNQTRGPAVTDLQLAALTIEHGGVLHTADRDFARFPGLRWRNPLL